MREQHTAQPREGEAFQRHLYNVVRVEALVLVLQSIQRSERNVEKIQLR